MKPIPTIAVVALLTVQAAVARSQSPGSAPSDSRGARVAEVHRLQSPPVFEQLARDLAELDAQTTRGARTALAASAFVGAVYREGVGWYAAFGPAVSFRFLFTGASAPNVHALRRRLDVLSNVSAKRLEWLIQQDCSGALLKSEAADTRIQEALIVLDGLMKELPNDKQRQKSLQDAKVRYGDKSEALFQQLGTSLREPSKPSTEEPPKQGPLEKACMATPRTANAGKPAETGGDASYPPDARFDYQLSVVSALIDQWQTERANLEFLRLTAQRTDKLLAMLNERFAEVAEQNERFFQLGFVEGNLGYTFQASENGLSRNLGGLTVGGGLGTVTAGPDVSIGVMGVEGGAWGPYLALSAEIL